MTATESKKNFGGIRHHYWEWPIATYLFLGGLGGGIFALNAIMSLLVYPEYEVVQSVFAWPSFLGIVFLALGCVLLVFELGQPLVFIRAFIKSTSIICWGARILTVCMIFGLLWFVSFIPWEWFRPIADLFVFYRPLNLALAGISGAGIMLYTGIFLSSLKAHSFWASPALPVLFTISALSTACACITLSIGWWPVDQSYMNEAHILELLYAGAPEATTAYLTYSACLEITHILHTVDIILVVCEVVVLLVMVLSFLGAGNVTANKVAHRWVNGSWALLFWIGMIGCGLVLPELMYVFGAETFLSTVLAPALVLIGGLILRFMVVYSDERKPLPGEDIYYGRLVGNDAEFLHRWKYGKNEF